MTIDPDRFTAVVWRFALLAVFVWMLSSLLAGAVGYRLGYAAALDHVLEMGCD